MPPPLPVEALMRDEFEQRPFGGRGGIVGEFASHPPPGERIPPPPPPQPFVIPPPDWEQEAREQQARERAAELDRARELLKEDER